MSHFVEQLLMRTNCVCLSMFLTNRDQISHLTFSDREADGLADEMEGLAKDKFALIIMALGATPSDFIETGGKIGPVVTKYNDKSNSKAAFAEIA